MSEEEQDEELLADIRKAVEEINAYYQELAGESARAAAILAVGSLEDELESLVASKFPGINRKLWKELAGPGFTPLGSFKTKKYDRACVRFLWPENKKHSRANGRHTQ